MEVDGGGGSGVRSAYGGGRGGSGGSDRNDNRKRKTISQLEILENIYAGQSIFFLFFIIVFHFSVIAY